MKSNNQDGLVTRKRFSVNHLGNTKENVTSKNNPMLKLLLETCKEHKIREGEEKIQ